jgi:hypothetical protein
MPSQNDVMRYYQEKISHIESQIRELDRHVAELDAFEKREMSRNLPNEYKEKLHSTVSRAKGEAGVVKQKAVAAANNLKQRIHAFMQKPKN